MLHGKALGQAIDEAIKLKIDSGKIKSRTDVARTFGVSPQAIRGWVQTGSISKDKIPLLWQYFSDVVGPDHWGLSTSDMLFIQSGAPQQSVTDSPWPFSLTKREDILRLSKEQLHQLDLMIAAYLLGAQSNAPKSDDGGTTAA